MHIWCRLRFFDSTQARSAETHTWTRKAAELLPQEGIDAQITWVKLRRNTDVHFHAQPNTSARLYASVFNFNFIIRSCFSSYLFFQHLTGTFLLRKDNRISGSLHLSCHRLQMTNSTWNRKCYHYCCSKCLKFETGFYKKWGGFNDRRVKITYLVNNKLGMQEFMTHMNSTSHYL